MNSMFRKIIAYVLVFTMALTMNVNVFAAADVVAQTEPTATVEDVHNHEHSEDGECLVEEESFTDETTAGEEETPADEPSSEPVENGSDEGPQPAVMSLNDGETESSTEPAAQSDDGIIASGTCGDNLSWEMDENYVLTISGTGEMTSHPWNSNVTKVIIEEGVTSIAESAFEACYSLSGELVLPSTLKSIGGYAFSGCKGLSGELVIPKSVELIGPYAFSNTGISGELVIPEGIEKIETHAFELCLFTKVSIPDSVNEIADNAFTSCINLETVEIGSAVKTIGSHIFSDRQMDVYFNNTEEAWNSIDIGEDNDWIASSEISFANGGTCGENATWSLSDDGILTISGTGTMSDYMNVDTPWDQFNAQITSIVVEEGITAIGRQAFADSDATSVTLPDGLEVIGAGAFICCPFPEIELPETLTTIGSAAFGDCDTLTEIVLPESVSEIGDEAFTSCDNMGKITILNKNCIIAESSNNGTIPEMAVVSGYAGSTAEAYAEANGNTFQAYECMIGVHVYNDGTVTKEPLFTETGVKTYKCGYCNKEKYEDIPVIEYVEGACGDELTWHLEKDGTLTISGTGDMYDYGLDSDMAPWRTYDIDLKTLVLEEGITIIGTYAFHGCNKFEGQLVLPEGLTSIGNGAFTNTSFTGNLVIPEGVTSIERYAFLGCDKFDGTLTLPGSLKTIVNGTFMSCENFTGTLTIPEGVETIEAEAFVDCMNLTEVIVPESVTSIGQYAFHGCTNVLEIRILNKNCDIYDQAGTIAAETAIVGYADSTAAAYAEKYDHVLIPYECIIGTHFYNDGTITKVPTCVEEGTVEKECGVCHKKTIEKLPPDAASHTWDTEYTVDTPATCTAPGVQSIHCIYCDAVKDGTALPIVALGHNFGEWITVKEPTCTDKGEKQRKCSRCGEAQLGEVEELGHTWEVNFTVDKAPTCTSEGEKSIHCKVCDDGRKEITVIEKLPHAYGDFTVVSANYRHRTCGDCGYLYEEHLEFAEPQLSIEKGNYDYLSYSEYELGDYSEADMIITSSNDSIASVLDGKITAHRFGRVTITAKVGGVTAKCEVEVTDPNLLDAGYCGDNLFWALTEDGALTIYGKGEMYYYGCHYENGYNQTDAPWGQYVNSINSLTLEEGITLISDYAFSNCYGIRNELSIPDTVKVIGCNSFYRCLEMTGDIDIPEGVSEIKDHAFSSCESLDGTLTLPESLVSIGDYAFANCSSLTGSLYIPENVTQIGERAFAECSKLTGDLIIPEGIKTIERYAFDSCSGLNGQLIIPETVTAIEDGAFYNCSKLSGNLNIPESVVSIGYSAFSDCSGFTGELKLHDKINVLEDYAFSGCTGFTGDLVIPDTFTSISSFVFSGCTGFDGYLMIPESVSKIGSYAFNRCTGLKGKLNLPSGLTEIGYSTFNGCAGLTGDLFIPDKVIKIGNNAFSECTGLNGRLVLPDSITEIGSQAFYKCEFEGELVLPEKLQKIDSMAFCDCKGFTGNLVIPANVTAIGYQSFGNCDGFDGTLTLPAGLKTIGSYAFYGCRGLTGELIIPDSVTVIEDYAFEGCNGFTGDLVLPQNLKTIEQRSFSNCYGLNGVVYIPQTVSKIESSAFNGCYNVDGFVLPDNVLSIEDGVFPYQYIDYDEGCTFWVYPESYAEQYVKENYSSHPINYLVDEPYKPEQNDFFELKNNEISMNRYDVVDVADLVTSNQEISADRLSVKIDDSSVAMFDDYGCEIAALGTGQTGFTISYGDLSCIGTLTVYEETYDIIPTSLEFAENEMVLEKGTYGYNPINMTPAEPGMESKLTWSTDDNTIATVDSNGIVTGVKAGTTKVTAKYSSSVSATYDVTVGTALDSIVVPDKYSDLTLYKRDTAKLKYYTYPYDAYEKEVHFSSSDEEVVTVDENGVITAVGVGEAEIEISSAYSCMITNKVKVTVINPLKGISFKNPTINVENLNSAQLELVLDPYDAVDVGKVTYTSNRPGVVSVDQTGKVTTTGFGIATITAEVNGFKAQCRIIAPELKLTGIDIEESGKELTYGGAGSKLTANRKPYNTTDENKLVWSSSNEKVVTVDQNGVITPVGAGEADIYIYEGNFEDSCRVTVNKAVPEFKYPEGLTGKVGTTLADVELPEGFVWEDETQKITARGPLTFKASYNPDPDNYETVEGIDVSVRGIDPIVIGFELNTSYIETECQGTVDIHAVNIEGQDPEFAEFEISSSNEDVATVDANGKITVNGSGETTITFVSGSATAECFIVAEHNVVTDEAKAPTCTETGLTEGSHCTVCDKVFAKQAVIPANGHTEVFDFAVSPTCTETGLTVGSHCSVCDEILMAQEVIPAAGHSMVYDDEIPATCTQAGATSGGYCQNCDYTVDAGEIPALGHNYGDWIIDEEPTCVEEGAKHKVCGRCGEVVTESIETLPHMEVISEAVAPTCTESGLTEGCYCEVCGDTIIEQEEIPATGHDMVYTESIPPTCMEDGYASDGYCKNCDYTVKGETIPKLDHNFGMWVVETPAEFGKPGVEGQYCTNDGCTAQNNREITIVDSGKAGENVTWTIDCDKVITFSGSGPIEDPQSYSMYDCIYRDIVIEEGITEIPDMAFDNQPQLRSVKLADSIERIGNGAFQISGGLTGNIELPANLKYIGDWAFYETAITGQLVIPEGVTYIGEYAFGACKSLTGTLVIPAEIKQVNAHAFECCKGLEKLVIENGIESIGDNAFYDCNKLSGDLVIPDTVKYIGDYAFYRCQGITDLDLGEGITSIGEWGLGFTETYTEKDTIVLPESLEKINANSFGAWNFDTIVVLNPDCVLDHGIAVINKVVGYEGSTAQRYVGCILAHMAKFVHLCDYYGNDHNWSEETVTQEPTCTENGWADVTCMTCGMPHMVVVTSTGHEMHAPSPYVAPTCTTDGYEETWYCGNCKKTFYDEKGTTEVVGPSLIPATGHKWSDEIVLKPPTCTEDGYGDVVCAACGEMQAITLPKLGHDLYAPVAYIPPTCTEQGCDYYLECRTCKKLFTDGSCSQELAEPPYIPATGHSFYNEWTVVTPPAIGRVGIERQYCHNCNVYNEREITIVSTGSCGTNTSWIVNTNGVMTISGTGEVYGSVPFSDATNGITKLVFEEGITAIYADFVFADKLTDVEFANSIKTIGNAAFKGVNISGKLVLPTGLESIGMNAFADCKGLTELQLNKGLKAIGSNAFAGCSGLTGTLDIPDSVTSLGMDAFNGCSGFTGLNLGTGISSLELSVFRNCSSISGHIIIPENVSRIDDGALFGCTNIAAVIITNENCNFGGYTNAIDKSITLAGKVGSTTEQYARMYGFKFSNICDYLGNNHIYGAGVVTTQPTVTQTGVMTYTCKECNHVKTTVLPALGQEGCDHKNVMTLPAVGAGCETTGMTAGSQCMDCGKIMIAQTVIPAYGHNYDQGVVIKAPTATTVGTKLFTCQNCGKTKTTEIPAIGNVIASGVCGGNTSYVLTVDGTMTISGTGAMNNFEATGNYYVCEAPWKAHLGGIKKVVIEEGVTHIGRSAFIGAQQLMTVEVPSTLESVGDLAFYNCKKLVNFQFKEGLKEIGNSAFNDCFNYYIDTLILPASLEKCEEAFGMITIHTLIVKNPKCSLSFSGTGISKIIGAKNSTAQQLSYQMGSYVPFEYICKWNNQKHELVQEVGYEPPTCTTTGKVGYYTCNNCVDMFEDAEGTKQIAEPGVIPALGHDVITTPGVEATCTTAGYTEEQYCDRCGEYFKTLQMIPATGHNYGSGVITKAPTATVTGIMTYTCKSCSSTKAEVIPATGSSTCKHTKTQTIAPVAATCTTPGKTEGIKCVSCGKIIVEQVVIPSFGHNYDNGVVIKEATFATAGERLFTCMTCKDTKTVEIPALGVDTCTHEFLEVVPGYDATCTTDGLSDGLKCGNCFYIIEHQEPIEATGHSWDEWYEEDSTCEKIAFMRMCENCGKEETKYEKGEGHEYETFTKVITRATQKAAGKLGTYKYCANCQSQSKAKLTSTTAIQKIAPVKMSATAFVHNGKSRIPVLTIKDAGGKTLKKGTDYRVTIKNAKKKVVAAPKAVGRYQITVEFIGNYKGFVYKNYNINPKGTVLGKLTSPAKKQLKVTWTKKPAAQVTGYQIRYGTKQNLNLKGSKLVLVQKANLNNRVIKNLKPKTKYWVQIRTYKTVNGVKYFSAWSVKKQIKTK